MAKAGTEIVKAHMLVKMPEALSPETKVRIASGFLPTTALGLKHHLDLSAQAPYVLGKVSLPLDRPEWSIGFNFFKVEVSVVET